MSDLKEIAITDHHLGYIKTGSGISINLRDPKPEDICLKDIASGLSKICRFGGQCDSFYSVAQHSVLVAHLVSQAASVPALLHDAPEAYIGDVIKPLKVILGDVYADIEEDFAAAIRGHFFPGSHTAAESFKRVADYLFYPEIKKCDILALQIEDEAFRQGKPERLRFYFQKFDMLMTDTQLGWPPYLAEILFMKYFKKMSSNL